MAEPKKPIPARKPGESDVDWAKRVLGLIRTTKPNGGKR